jgi:lysophospholipase L1-like esterase
MREDGGREEESAFAEVSSSLKGVSGNLPGQVKESVSQVSLAGRIRGLPAKIVLIVLASAVALGAGELVARMVAGAAPFDEEMVRLPHLTERDRELRWRYPPAEGRNSLGLRDGDIGDKAPDATRVLFLGDSLVWSSETGSGLLATEVLEANLNRVAGGDQDFEVINAGVPGYTTYQELEFLRVYGLEMEPDLVLLGFVFNDVYCPYLHRPTREGILDSEPSHHLHHFDTSTRIGSLLSGSYLAHLAYFAGERALRALSGRPSFPFERRGDFYLAWKAHGWRCTERLLEAMREELEARGVPLVVIVYPIRDQLTATYLEADREHVLYPQLRVTGICRELDIPYLDLTPILAEGGGRALFRDSLHLGPEGNDLVAATLTGYLTGDGGGLLGPAGGMRCRREPGGFRRPGVG